MDRRGYLAAVAGTVVGVAGCVGTGSGLSADEYDVGMSADAFLPDAYEAGVGETVVWGNSGSRNHSVTAYGEGIPPGAAYFASGGFDSEAAARDAWFEHGKGVISSGETYEHTFEVPGEHNYFCIPHERTGMVGTIQVTE